MVPNKTIMIHRDGAKLKWDICRLSFMIYLYASAFKGHRSVPAAEYICGKKWGRKCITSKGLQRSASLERARIFFISHWGISYWTIWDNLSQHFLPSQCRCLSTYLDVCINFDITYYVLARYFSFLLTLCAARALQIDWHIFCTISSLRYTTCAKYYLW